MTEYNAADLRKWRARLKINQTDAAKLFNVAQTTYSLWERGETPRNFSRRFQLVLALLALSQTSDPDLKAKLADFIEKIKSENFLRTC